MPEKVLVVGRTGRDMALAEAIGKSDEVERIFCLSGNAGTESLPKVTNVDIWHLGVEGMARFAQEHRDGLLVVIGSQGPQWRGLGDLLRSQEIPVLGATMAAARLEGSKVFADGFMKRYNIPHPDSKVATSPQQGLDLIGNQPSTKVIKADGPAFGRGVVLPANHHEAEQAIETMFTGEFKEVCKNGVVIQERLTGPERSIFVICGEKNYQIMPFFARDYKRLKENDQGPNTGGMGSYARVASEMMSPGQFEAIKDITDKTVQGMIDIGSPFQGVLYIGIMFAKEYDDQPVVIEYNARLGDPEAQAALPLMTNAGFDMHRVFHEAAVDKVPALHLPRLIGETAVTVSLLSHSYPNSPDANVLVHGLGQTYTHAKAYHNSTTRAGGDIYVSGSRALDITGIGTDVDAAAKAAYAAIGTHGIHFSGMRYRSDIGREPCAHNEAR